MGAWIETKGKSRVSPKRSSHPTWVRGLKHDNTELDAAQFVSHPTWVRGLKLCSVSGTAKKSVVAPYVGAWIETQYAQMANNPNQGRTLRGCVD